MGTGRSRQDSQTSQVLRELLESRPDYRRRWQERAERRRSDGISKAGVARVIALHLWGSGERADSDTSLPRNLKDRVRRAIDGDAITPQTLAWFIEAFGMDERDEDTLWATLAADQQTAPGISYTLTSRQQLALRQRHRTTALFERFSVGADHSFTLRKTMHTIMALDDGVDVYPYNHEPEGDRVEVVYGGTLGQRFVYPDGRYTDAIMLHGELKRGETMSLEYETHYPPGGYQATEVRRSARGRSENIDIAVAFDRAALPGSVFWSVWPDYRDGPPVLEEPVLLDQRHSVRRFVRFIEQTVVGFRWSW